MFFPIVDSALPSGPLFIIVLLSVVMIAYITATSCPLYIILSYTVGDDTSPFILCVTKGLPT
jgi:hypothetical protein